MLVLLVMLALAVNTLLPELTTLQATAQVLRHMRWWAVALAVGAQLASYCGNGYTVQSVAHLTRDTLGLWEAIRLALAAGSVGVMTWAPVGYAAATYRWTRVRGMSHQGAVLCGWLPGVVNTAVLTGLSLAGLFHLMLRHLLGRSQLVSLGGLFVTMTALLVAAGWLLSREARVTGFAARIVRTWSRLRRRDADPREVAWIVRRIALTRRLIWSGGWRRPLLGAVVNAGFDVVTLFCLFVAAHYAITPAALIAGYGLPQLVGRLSFLPGGLGITEGGMVGLYVALGIPSATAVLVVLAYRGLSFWLPTLIGFALAPLLQRGARRRDAPNGRLPRSEAG
jgi:uncharacterized membrane protein YbhN (UPF0104 family)